MLPDKKLRVRQRIYGCRGDVVVVDGDGDRVAARCELSAGEILELHGELFGSFDEHIIRQQNRDGLYRFGGGEIQSAEGGVEIRSIGSRSGDGPISHARRVRSNVASYIDEYSGLQLILTCCGPLNAQRLAYAKEVDQ